MAVERREFLGWVGVGALALAAPVGGGCAVVRADLGRTEPGLDLSDESAAPPAAAVELTDDERELLRLASLAPSGHNAQPWRVRVEGPGRWLLCADPARRLPAVDPDDRELHVSLGAFVENLAQAAPAFGRRLVVAAPAPADGPDAVARLQLAAGPREDADLDRIRRRRTVKRGLSCEPLGPETVERLLGPAGGGVRFVPADDPAAGWLAESALAAFEAQSARDQAQTELAGWIRFRNADARARCDGLTTASMEIGGFGGWWVRTFYGPDDVLSAGFRARGVVEVADRVREGAGWLVVSSAGDGLADRLDAGRRFERVALSARGLGLGLHPLSQVLEETPWRDEVAARLGVPGRVQLLVRVGRVADYREPVSLRRPVAQFVEDAYGAARGSTPRG
jgi:hypothetical protein